VADEQPKLDTHLLDYWHVIVKRRWVVLMSLVVVIANVVLYTFLADPIYTASARIQIERNAPNILPFQDVMSMTQDYNIDFYATQMGLIQSRHVAREVIESLKLYRHDEFKMEATEGTDPAEPGPASEANLIDRFLARLSVEPFGKSSLFDVSFSARDSALAARVANRVAETYIAYNSEARYNTSERATESLALQTASLHEELELQERELQEYAREHGIIPFSENQDLPLKNLGDLRSALIRSRADRIEKEARYVSLRDSNAGSLPEILKNDLIQGLTQELAELERREAQLSVKVKPDWPEMVRLRREIETARNHLETERHGVYWLVLGSAESDYLAAKNEEQALNQALEQEKEIYHELSLKEIQYDNLEAEIADKRETLGALIRRQSETGTSGDMQDPAAGNIRIVDRAEVPAKPSSPKRRLNTIMGLLAGMVIGVSLAFFLEYLDLSIKTPEEVYRATGLGTIGTIPAMRPAAGKPAQRRKEDSDGGGRMELISHEDNWSVPSEAFRKMRTAFLVSQPSGPPQTVLVTSSQPGEGKTSISLNLAITLAQLGRRVLLVDSDLRKPRQHKFLGVPNQTGFSTYLSSAEIPALQPVPTGIEGLDLIPSGPTPPNPSDLLDSNRLVQILGQLQAQGYDHILLDSPPVLAVADPAILASRVEGVVMVVHAGTTKKEALQHAIDRLRQVKAKILGVALNHTEQGSGSYYGYSYESYGEAKDSKPLASVTRLRRK